MDSKVTLEDDDEDYKKDLELDSTKQWPKIKSVVQVSTIVE